MLQAQGGSIAVYVALTLPLFLGMAGLAVDVASWYQLRRTVQSAADAAAYAGALDLARQGLDGDADVTAVEAVANDAAARNGLTTPVTVNLPPKVGLAAGDPGSVEVIVSEPAPLYFTSLFLNEAPPVSARAIAKAVVSDACIWSLHPTAKAAFKIAGTAEVELGCGLVVNSDHAEAALDQNGGSCLTASSIAVHGGYSGDCVDPEPEVFTPDYGNPLAGMAEPAVGACDENGYHYTGSGKGKKDEEGGGPVTLTPGVYCNGLQISGGEVTFEPGLYVIDGGTFKITGNAKVSNSENGWGGVTFFLTGSGSKYAEIDIASGAEVTFTPMTAGALPNVLFFQDPDAPNNGTNKFTGGSTMNLTGILYFPSQEVQFAGGSSANEAEILLVASIVTFTGNSHLSGDYATSLLPKTFFARLVD